MEIEFDAHDIDLLEEAIENGRITNNMRLLVRLLRENSEVTILVEET